MTDRELADRATAIYRLFDDLPFEDACRVLNAVITAKVEVHVPVPKSLVGELSDDCTHLAVQDREAGPTHAGLPSGPELKQVSILVPNKLTVLVNEVDVGRGEHMNEEVTQ